MSLDRAKQIMAERWGFSDFRAGQEDALRAVFSGKDVLGVFPVGYGKTLIFQLSALTLGGTVIVISPLIALMEDQCRQCKQRGIAAAYLNSTLSPAEITAILKELSEGKLSLLYLAPERIGTPLLTTALRGLPVSMVVIDEAHTVTMYGDSFRPAFSRIPQLIEMVTYEGKRPLVMAVTATAPANSEEVVAKACGLAPGYSRFVLDPIRSNFTYGVSPNLFAVGLSKTAKDLLSSPGKHLVYTRTHKETEELASHLRETLGAGASVGYYHGGLRPHERTETQDKFTRGLYNILVCTNAFGMGIDIPDINTVLHTGICSALEDYVQESGRGGRGGQPTTVLVQYSGVDDKAAYMRKAFIERAYPDYEIIASAWRELINLAKDEPGKLLPSNVLSEEIAALIFADYQRSSSYQQIHKKETVNGALNIISRTGVVSFLPTEDCTVQLVKRAALQEILPECTGVGARLGQALLEFGRNARTQDYEVSSSLNVLADRAACTALQVAQTIKAFQKASVLKPTRVYGHRLVQVEPQAYDAKITEILPPQETGRKNRAVWARYNAMKSYVLQGNNDSRLRAYIRSYFGGN